MPTIATKRKSSAPLQAGPAWEPTGVIKIVWARWFGTVTPAIYTEDFLSAANWTVPHNLGSNSVIVQVWDSTGLLVSPTSIQIQDTNTVIITFSAATEGYVVVLG